MDSTTFHSGIGAGDHADGPIEPLISTTRFSIFPRFGSLRSASATFWSGPTATSVIAPGFFLTVSTMKSAAGWAMGCVAVKSSAHANWKSRLSEVFRPTATGTSARPPAWSSLHATFARAGVLPSPIVTPTSSTSGDSMANPSAHASSMSPPMSVSRMTLTFSCASAEVGSAAAARAARVTIQMSNGLCMVSEL